MSGVPEAPSQLIAAMRALEKAFRKLHPLAIPELKSHLDRYAQALMSAHGTVNPSWDEKTRQALEHAHELVLDSIRVFGTGHDLTEAFMAVLRSMRKHCRAQEELFSIRGTFPQIDGYFLEDGAASPVVPSGHAKQTLFHVGGETDPYARGAYSLYVPERHQAESPWPLVIALHGGYGHGRDYLWTWLREARSRGFILLCPSSTGRTWSIGNIPVDAEALMNILGTLRSRYTIDSTRILLTGMSDGGTFALGFGLSGGCPTHAIAPVSCVLPPADLARAKDMRIYWVHGEQDWMFPLGRTVAACRELSWAGSDVRLRIVPDLSHTYPREENASILAWFDPFRAALKSDA